MNRPKNADGSKKRILSLPFEQGVITAYRVGNGEDLLIRFSEVSGVMDFPFQGPVDQIRLGRNVRAVVGRVPVNASRVAITSAGRPITAKLGGKVWLSLVPARREINISFLDSTGIVVGTELVGPAPDLGWRLKTRSRVIRGLARFGLIRQPKELATYGPGSSEPV